MQLDKNSPSPYSPAETLADATRPFVPDIQTPTEGCLVKVDPSTVSPSEIAPDVLESSDADRHPSAIFGKKSSESNADPVKPPPRHHAPRAPLYLKLLGLAASPVIGFAGLYVGFQAFRSDAPSGVSQEHVMPDGTMTAKDWTNSRKFDRKIVRPLNQVLRGSKAGASRAQVAQLKKELAALRQAVVAGLEQGMHLDGIDLGPYLQNLETIQTHWADGQPLEAQLLLRKTIDQVADLRTNVQIASVLHAVDTLMTQLEALQPTIERQAEAFMVRYDAVRTHSSGESPKRFAARAEHALLSAQTVAPTDLQAAARDLKAARQWIDALTVALDTIEGHLDAHALEFFVLEAIDNHPRSSRHDLESPRVLMNPILQQVRTSLEALEDKVLEGVPIHHHGHQFDAGVSGAMSANTLRASMAFLWKVHQGWCMLAGSIGVLLGALTVLGFMIHDADKDFVRKLDKKLTSLNEADKILEKLQAYMIQHRARLEEAGVPKELLAKIDATIGMANEAKNSLRQLERQARQALDHPGDDPSSYLDGLQESLRNLDNKEHTFTFPNGSRLNGETELRATGKELMAMLTSHMKALAPLVSQVYDLGKPPS